MGTPEQDLYAIHKLCWDNDQRVKESTQSGCFYCLKIFPSSNVNDWSGEAPRLTALCPHCGYDTVLADDGSYKFSAELLQAMKDEFFYEPTADEVNNTKTHTSIEEMMEDKSEDGNRPRFRVLHVPDVE